MDKKFSIIIPVFNSECFIKKCLLSCIDQDIKSNEYEIIVINDGSTDNSLTIIMDVAKDFANIFVINKSNGGASSARNKGLDLATGKYIWFVDSDDWIEANCINRVYNIMENEQLDALQICYYTITNGMIMPIEEKYRVTTSVLTPKAYISPDSFIGGTNGTIFKRNIAEKYFVRFDDNLRLAEDQLFFLSIFNYSVRVKRENLLIYYYLIHSKSIIHNADEEQLYQSISKISSFEFLESTKEYCDYLIYRQFILLMNLPSKKVKRLHHLMKSILLDKNFNYDYFSKRDKRLLFGYYYFGLVFMKAYTLLRMIYLNLKSFFYSQNSQK